MAVKRRCPHCNKKLKKYDDTHYVCENHEPPIYYPPLPDTEDTKNENE